MFSHKSAGNKSSWFRVNHNFSLPTLLDDPRNILFSFDWPIVCSPIVCSHMRMQQLGTCQWEWIQGIFVRQWHWHLFWGAFISLINFQQKTKSGTWLLSSAGRNIGRHWKCCGKWLCGQVCGSRVCARWGQCERTKLSAITVYRNASASSR
jgi:hypothetical protein